MERLSSESGTSGVGMDILGALSGMALPETAAKAEDADRGRWWSPRSMLAVAASLLCAHGAASVFLSQHGSVTCLGLGGCYGLASGAAYLRGRCASGMLRARWMLVSVGLGLGALSFGLTLYRECVLRAPGEFAGIQDVALLLRGLPFLMAVSLSDGEQTRVVARLDAAYSVLAAGLAWVALQLPFASSGVGSALVAGDAALVAIVAANLGGAALVTVRCFGDADEVDRRFFRLLAGFLWANALVTGWVDFYAIRLWQVAPGSPVLLLGDLPVLGLLAGIALWDGRRVGKPATIGGATVANTVASMFVPLWILLLAVSLAPHHLLLGMGGVAATFVLYGTRSVVLQKDSLLIQQELQRANESIQDQALSDGLTGIPNRRNFDLTLEREWKRAQRSKQPLALLMVDIDHFKELNDRHGHLTGDGCLREIARLLRAGLGREADFAARYGGEEFAILLIDTGIEGGRIVGESLRRSVEQHQCAAPDGSALSFTVSIGVASEVPMQQESSMTLIAAADKALYRAKRGGRNRVEMHAWRTGFEASAKSATPQ